MKETYPFVLKAIAEIFICLNPDDDKELAEFEEPFRELLEGLLDFSTKLDITNDSDVDYGNLFYTNLVEAFHSYAIIYYNNKHLTLKMILRFYNLFHLILFDKLFIITDK